MSLKCQGANKKIKIIRAGYLWTRSSLVMAVRVISGLRSSLVLASFHDVFTFLYGLDQRKCIQRRDFANTHYTVTISSLWIRRLVRPNMAIPARTFTIDLACLTWSLSLIPVSLPMTIIPTFSFSKFKLEKLLNLPTNGQRHSFHLWFHMSTFEETKGFLRLLVTCGGDYDWLKL